MRSKRQMRDNSDEEDVNEAEENEQSPNDGERQGDGVHGSEEIDNDDDRGERENLDKQGATVPRVGAGAGGIVATGAATGAIPKLSLGGGNKKIILMKPTGQKGLGRAKHPGSLANHKVPKIDILVDSAIRELNERSGSSLVAIKKYIVSKHPDVDEKRLYVNMKKYIKGCLLDGKVVQIKRSFKLTAKHKAEGTKPKREVEKTTAVGRGKDKDKLEKKSEKQSKEKEGATKGQAAGKESKPAVVRHVGVRSELSTAAAAIGYGADGVGAKKPRQPNLGKVSRPQSAADEKLKEVKKRFSKSKLARKSIGSLIKPTPKPKTTKKAPKTAAVIPENPAALLGPANGDVGLPVAAPPAIRTTGRAKKK